MRKPNKMKTPGQQTEEVTGKEKQEILESIIRQSIRDFELIIIDDCSTDSSVEIIQTWISKTNFPQIRLIVNPENLGVCKTLNIAIDHSVGEYICMIAAL